MPPFRRVTLCGVILTFGYAAQAALEHWSAIERPLLRSALASVPMELGDWVGQDVGIEPDIVERSQATEYINRDYEWRGRPGRRLRLWINYSNQGLNLRHSPEICLPSGGWTKAESLCRLIPIRRGDGEIPIMRLAYAQGELVQEVGFWYYIFGEGQLERYVRRLAITNKSSHGRTTRGSGMTVEIFCPGEFDPDGEALRNFAGALLEALEPILPEDRAEYYIP